MPQPGDVKQRARICIDKGLESVFGARVSEGVEIPKDHTRGLRCKSQCEDEKRRRHKKGKDSLLSILEESSDGTVIRTEPSQDITRAKREGGTTFC